MEDYKYTIHTGDPKYLIIESENELYKIPSAGIDSVTFQKKNSY